MIKELFSIFTKPSQAIPFQVDLHSHLIPGIDDGVKSIEESIEIIRHFEAMGVKKLITTPHIMKGVYDNTPETILSGLREVQEAIQRSGIDVQLEAAAEYHVDIFFEQLLEKDDAKVLSFGGGYVLIETGFLSEPMNFRRVVFRLKALGYEPILAHVERYIYIHDASDSRLQELKDMGLHFQINLGSITGHYGEPVKRCAQRLIEGEWVDFVGSDIHRRAQWKLLQHAWCSKGFKTLKAQAKVKNDSLL